MDLLRDDLKKLYFKFLIPSLGSAMVMSIYTLTDAIVICKGVGQSVQPVISTNYGANNIGRINTIKRMAYTTILIMGVLFSLLGILFPRVLSSVCILTFPVLTGGNSLWFAAPVTEAVTLTVSLVFLAWESQR